MENETQTAPEQSLMLSSDHKLKLLLAQRDALSAKVVFDSAQRTYQDKIRAVNDVATGIGNELKLDLDKWIINMDNLTLEPAQK
jgi:hypothetical protein